MDSDELGFLTLSDSEKALLAEVKEAVLAAENSGAFDDASAAAGGGSGSWEHPAVRFLASTFVRKCLTQLEVLRSHGVAYSLKELVWFVLNLERDPAYMLGLSGSDCTEEQVRSLADRMPSAPVIAVPPEPLLLLPGSGSGLGGGAAEDEAASSASADDVGGAGGGGSSSSGCVVDWPTVQEALERLRRLVDAAVAADDERRRPRRGLLLPVERPSLTLALPDLPDMPPCPLDPAAPGR